MYMFMYIIIHIIVTEITKIYLRSLCLILNFVKYYTLFFCQE